MKCNCEEKMKEQLKKKYGADKIIGQYDLLGSMPYMEYEAIKNGKKMRLDVINYYCPWCGQKVE